MNTDQIQQLLNDSARICILSTCDDTGKPNSAIYGSSQLENRQILIGCGDNRSLSNLKNNPQASLMIFIPGANVLSFKGVRLQMTCSEIEDSGPELDAIREDVRLTAGRTAARMVQYLLRFEIEATRDLVDMSHIFGQSTIKR